MQVSYCQKRIRYLMDKVPTAQECDAAKAL